MNMKACRKRWFFRFFAGTVLGLMSVVQAAPFAVDASLPAGNVIVEGIADNTVRVRQDLRGGGLWFYWAFRVTGAAGRTVKFVFTDKRWNGPVGVRGPVVSTDGGKTFSYPLDGKSRTDGFTYTFGADEHEVFFYECHPYVRADWDAFVARHAARHGRHFVTETLCKSRRLIDVPCARFGCVGRKPKFRFFVSARHHCSESMASWVLEGLGEAFFASDTLGNWLRANVELMMVPFVDYDGVQAGDQGKYRHPHDHNRDYSQFLYPETKAIAEWIARHAGGRLDVFLDVHCPWIRGLNNEFLYTPWKDPAILPDAAAEKRFSELLETYQCGTMRYRAADDLPFGEAWNKGINYRQGWSSVIWACHTVKGLKIARSYEVPFANANGAVVTPETCRALGRDTARTLYALFSEPAPAPVSSSGIYPHLAMYNNEAECGTGALLPWAGSLWAVTYGPHCPAGSSDRLYRIAPDLTREIHPASVGGTPAGRMIHRETQQAVIGPYVIDSRGGVRVLTPSKMPGRLTAVARHLTDPANKIYIATMDNGLYEVDLRTCTPRTLLRDHNRVGGGWANVKIQQPADWHAARDNKLPGSHTKGMCIGYGRIFLANNGEYVAAARTNPRIPAGVLGSTDAEGGDQKTVRRCQFTDIATPDGIYGNEHPARNPIWSLGWDAKSVLLACRTGKGWSYYRLPKASHTYDGAHGWNTEWPRIRDIGERDLLATMHGTMWRFPRGFRPGAARGIRPRSTFLKVTGDFCRWNGRVVFGCDDSARSEFLNKRRAKGSLKEPTRSQSNLWFVEPSALDELGLRTGWAGVFDREEVAAGKASDPFLAAGYDFKWLWVSGGTFDVEVDEKGDGTWRKRTVAGPGGHDVSGVNGEWMRLVARTAAKGVSAALFYRSADERPAQGALSGVAVTVPGAACGVLHVNGKTPGCLALAVSGSAGYAIDANFRIESVPADIAAAVYADAPLAKNVLTYEPSSILYVDDKGARWRLPYGTAEKKTFADGRVCREVCTERDHFNAGGIYYELPAENAHGFAGVRPVATHNLPVRDYCSWRGLYAMSLPGEIRLMAVDDLWKTGKARGFGGPWRETNVTAGVPSDPYLMNGFDRKKLDLLADAATTVTLEIDVDGWGTWIPAGTFALKPGVRFTQTFPRAFSGYWARLVCDRPATVTAEFTYE